MKEYTKTNKLLKMFSPHLATAVLLIHIFIILFIVGLFFLVPIGYKYNWNWQKSQKLRFFHLILISIVTFETLVGISCPLTVIENNLRGIYISNSFIDLILQKIVYWEFPTIVFLLLYSLCLFWTILMWFIFPPKIK